MTYPPFRVILKGIPKLFLLLLIISGCQKDDDPIEVQTTEITVEEELQSFFDAFISEGAKRGVVVDLTEVQGFIREIDEDNVAGQCSYSSAHPNRVVIDESYWNRTNFFGREMVVFHELGHCALARGHRDDSTPNGICQSIMNSGLSDCRLLYNVQNRDAYLDELFAN